MFSKKILLSSAFALVALSSFAGGMDYIEAKPKASKKPLVIGASYGKTYFDGQYAVNDSWSWTAWDFEENYSTDDYDSQSSYSFFLGTENKGRKVELGYKTLKDYYQMYDSNKTYTTVSNNQNAAFSDLIVVDGFSFEVADPCSGLSEHMTSYQADTLTMPYIGFKMGKDSGKAFSFAKLELGLFANVESSYTYTIYRNLDGDSSSFDATDANGCAEKVVLTAKRDSQVLPVFLSLGMDYEVTDKIDLGFEWGFFDTGDLSSTKPFFSDYDLFNTQTLSLHMAYKIS